MKQHKTIKAAAVICMLLYFSISNAQLTSSPLGKQPELPSWETYEFMKYGNIGASPYTGTVNYSVPIYTYKDNEFEIPISVDYATNGFRINHKSGILGQSWSLGGIGKITREIKGLPDERTKTVFGGEDISSIALYGYKEISDEALNENILCGGDNRVYTCLISQNNMAYDAEPDLYHFNFCGFSGSFRRTTKDSQGNYRYVFFNEATNSRAISVQTLNEENNIVLIDGNGYRYEFQADEYVKEPVDEAVGALKVRKFTSWHLSKITAPSGRKVEFIYYTDDMQEGDVSYYPTLAYGFSCIGSTTLVDGGSSSTAIDVVEHKFFNSVLTSVLLPDSTSIVFKYEPAEQEYRYMTPNGALDSVRRNPERLSSISVSNGGKLLKKIKFSFDVQRSPYQGVGNPITFLHGIDISGQGQFAFDYYPMAGYPALGSIKCDHWGYYNGESGGFDVNDFFNNLSFDNYNESYKSSFHKSPNFDAALSGSIRKISYPTGGYSEITYEPHTYCKNVVRNIATSFYPQLQEVDSTIETGGIRLKQIITYLSDDVPIDTTTYDYGAGGNLLNAPRYGIDYTAETLIANGVVALKRVKQFNLTNDMFNYNRTHIEYDRVREYKSGKGYKDYYYSTFSDYPDPSYMEVHGDENTDVRKYIFNFYGVNGGNKTRVTTSSSSNLVTNILTPIASMQQKRGLLTKEEFYDSNGILLKCKQNTYDFPSVGIDTVFTITGEVAKEVYYPRFNIELSYSKETDYFNNNHVSKETHYTYNKNGMPTSVTTSVSDSGTIVERNVYSGDSIASDSSVIAKMQENNIVNELLVSQTMKSGCLLNKVRYNYYLPDASNNALVRPASVEIWNPTDGWRQKSSYLFDNMGLLRQVTDASGMNTSYLWSYCGKHPVAIAQNASWQSLEQGLSATGCGTSDQLTARANLDDASFERLGTLGTYLPEASVNLYKYKLNAGISEVTMPNSLRTFYSYDGYGRLTSISDNNKKKLEQNEYYMQSIKPLTASMSCPTNCHVNDSISISATSQGGTGSYSYYWSIKNSDGNTIYSVTTSSGILDIVPSAIPNLVANDYTVECVVTDLVSEETVNMVSSLCVNHAKIEFSGISASFDLGSGSGTAIATIYTDTPVTVSFSVHCICSGQCTLKIGDTLCADTVSNGTYSYSFEAGITNVKLQVNSSFAETNVSLQIESAGDAADPRDFDSSKTINLEF